MTISRTTAAGCLACLLAAGSAHGQALFSNGPFVTHEGAHVSGEDVSLAQDVTYPGYTALGFTANPRNEKPKKYRSNRSRVKATLTTPKRRTPSWMGA